eukprot:5214605-Heterocapsa_arctica.AAC.1
MFAASKRGKAYPLWSLPSELWLLAIRTWPQGHARYTKLQPRHELFAQFFARYSASAVTPISWAPSDTFNQPKPGGTGPDLL